MGTEGQGVLLYLNQEGRGIGLTNKMRAYALQDKGFDTVEANHRLGFEDDERDFRIGAALLREMGISQIRLMTNNPKKIEMMEKQGIKVVERVPLRLAKGRKTVPTLRPRRRNQAIYCNGYGVNTPWPAHGKPHSALFYWTRWPDPA